MTMRDRNHSDPKTAMMSVPMTPQQYERIKKIAASHGLATANYVRRRLFGDPDDAQYQPRQDGLVEGLFK